MTIYLSPRSFIFGLGALSLAGYGGIAFAAKSSDPLFSYLFFFFSLFILYVLAGIAVTRSKKSALQGTVPIVVAFAIAFRVLLLPTPPILENDWARYLWDGYVLFRGENPYRFSPQEISDASKSFPASHDSGPMRTFTELSSEAEVSAVFQRIGHKWVKTIYPPLAQMLFAFSAWLKPGSLFALKLLYLALDLLTIATLLRALSYFNKPQSWVLFYAWSPLVVTEFFNKAHFDVLAVFLSVQFFYFLLRGSKVLAGTCLGLAALSKFFPVLFVPFVWRELRALGLLAFIVTFVLAWVPFLTTGSSPFSGASVFAGSWEYNSSFYALAGSLLGALGIERELASRIAVTILLGGYLLWKSRRDYTFEGLPRECAKVIAIALLLSPVLNPWYVTWLVPFLCFERHPAWVALSGLVCLSYVYFLHFEDPWWLRPIEFAPVLLLVLVGYARRQVAPVHFLMAVATVFFYLYYSQFEVLRGDSHG